MDMKCGVVGAGIIGRLRAQAVTRNPATTLAGVADTDIALAQRATTGTAAKALSDYRHLLDDPQVDAVFIATPVQLHEEMAVAAFAAGKHVLCEKPLANSVDACRRIVEAANRSGRTLAVGFNHRYYPSVKFLKQSIDQGLVGTIDHVRVFGGHEGLANFRADWQFKGPVSGGGAMMDAGIHMTDLTRYVLGEVREVYAVTSNRIWKVEGSEDNAMVILKGAGDVNAIYQATWTEWKGYRFFIDVYGDKGMVRAYYAPMFNLLVTQDHPGAKRVRRVKLYPEIILREKLKGWTSTTLLTFDDELADFLRMVQGQRVPLAGGWDGVRAVEIAQAAYRSSVSGEPVTLSTS
jgi:predicted dehydrogenase